MAQEVSRATRDPDGTSHRVTEIPDVQESGSAGTQEAAAAELILPEEASPFQRAPIVDAIQGLAASNPRNMGGVVMSTLLSATVSQLFVELQDAKQQLKDTQEELSGVRGRHASSLAQVAVLEERVSTHRQLKHLRNIAIVGGSVLVGVALQLGDDLSGVVRYLLGGIGLLLMSAGWLWPLTESGR